MRTKIFLRNNHGRLRPNLTKVGRTLNFAAGNIPGIDGQVDVVFVNDSLIKDLAARFRNSPHSTDVLAFCYGDKQGVFGEVVISLDTAKRQARERKISLAAELILLGVHGLLHIAGNGDEKKLEWCTMRKKEFEMLVKIL